MLKAMPKGVPKPQYLIIGYNFSIDDLNKKVEVRLVFLIVHMNNLSPPSPCSCEQAVGSFSEKTTWGMGGVTVAWGQ